MIRLRPEELPNYVEPGLWASVAAWNPSLLDAAELVRLALPIPVDLALFAFFAERPTANDPRITWTWERQPPESMWWCWPWAKAALSGLPLELTEAERADLWNYVTWRLQVYAERPIAAPRDPAIDDETYRALSILRAQLYADTASAAPPAASVAAGTSQVKPFDVPWWMPPCRMYLLERCTQGTPADAPPRTPEEVRDLVWKTAQSWPSDATDMTWDAYGLEPQVIRTMARAGMAFGAPQGPLAEGQSRWQLAAARITDSLQRETAATVGGFGIGLGLVAAAFVASRS